MAIAAPDTSYIDFTPGVFLCTFTLILLLRDCNRHAFYEVRFVIPYQASTMAAIHLMNVDYCGHF